MSQSKYVCKNIIMQTNTEQMKKKIFNLILKSYTYQYKPYYKFSVHSEDEF